MRRGILAAKPGRLTWIQSVPPAVAGGYAAGSACALADLFGAEAADAVETECENDAIFFTQADVETGKLNRGRTTIPRVSQRNR